LAVSWEQLFVWFTQTFDGPFAVIILMLVWLAVTLAMSDVKIGEMFRDGEGRGSAHQFVIFGSWVFASGLLLADLQASKKLSTMGLAIYLVVFSGSNAVVEFIAKWDGKHPWSPK
jgi:hypothetical protein